MWTRLLSLALLGASIAAASCACSNKQPAGRDATTYPPPAALHVLHSCLDKECSGDWFSPELGLEFDHPICVPGEPARRGIAVLDPAYQGRWSCQSATHLSFRPVEFWPVGARFAVALSSGLTALDGARLLSPSYHSFATGSPYVQAIVEVPLSFGGAVVRSTHFIIDLNGMVALADIEPYIQLSANGVPLPIELQYGNDHVVVRSPDHTLIELIPKQKLPPSADIVVRVTPGWKPEEGAVSSGYEEKETFRTVPPFEVALACANEDTTPCDGYVRISSSTPVDVELLRAAVKVTPEVPLQWGGEFDREGTELVFSAAWRPGVPYKITLARGGIPIVDLDGSPLPGEVSKALTFGRATPSRTNRSKVMSEPSLRLAHLDGGPGTGVRLRASNVSQYDAFVVPLSKSDAVSSWPTSCASWACLQHSIGKRKPGGVLLHRRVTIPPSGAIDASEWTLPLSIPRFGPVLVSVNANPSASPINGSVPIADETDDRLYDMRVYLHTAIDLVVNRLGHALSVRALERPTGKALADVSIEVHEEERVVGSGVTDQSGQIQFDVGDVGWRDFFIVGSRQDDWTYVRSERDTTRPEKYSDCEGWVDQPGAGLLTDRGLYLPGESIEVFGIARLGPDSAGGAVNVKLERPGEPRPVASTLVTAGSLGDFRAVVPIPENVLPVPHTVAVYAGARVLGGAWVQIAERHELPVALTVGPARPAYVDGERAEWHVTLSGEPRPNGRLVYRFIDDENRARTVFPPREHSSTFDPRMPWRWTDLPVRRGETRVWSSTQGVSRGSTRGERCEVGYFEGRESIAAESSVQVDSSPWELTMTATLPREQEPWRWIEPLVIVDDASGHRVRGARVRIEAHLAPGGAPVESSPPGEACDVTTAETPVRCRLRAPGGTYWLMASTRDPHGNLVTASRYSEYAGENGRPPPDASADVSTDKASYEAGDTVHVGLWSSHPRAAGVLIVEAEGQPARVHGFQIADHTARVNVPTTPAFARRLRLRARIYDPQTFEVSTSDVAVRVLPSAAAIAVRVTMGKGPYLQGEPLDVEASLTDGAGNAVEGNVLVLLADEQIWRATQYAVPDWTTAIWGAVERGYLAQHFGCRDTRWSTSSSSPEPRRVLPLVTTGLAGLKGSTVVSGPFPTHGGATRIAVTLPAHPGVYRTLAIAVADRFRTGTHEGQIDVTSSSIVETSPPR